MKKWKIDDLNITMDSVLRGQGADPEIIRSRSPRLVDTAEKALAAAKKLLEPKALVKELAVTSFQHNSLELVEEKKLTSALVTRHLVGARSIFAVVCTVGSKNDKYALEVMEDDIVLGPGG